MPAKPLSGWTRPAQRATQETDYGRRGKGDVFTACYERRAQVHWLNFLEQVEAEVAPDVLRVYAILDNLSMHHCADMLLFALAHPRWEFVYQLVYAAYLNLIEPWWKVLKALALQGRRFDSWAEIVAAVEAATSYWQARKHPFTWGRRRRHRLSRHLGAAVRPLIENVRFHSRVPDNFP